MPRRPDQPSRTCQVCGREMTWRKAWERSFKEVRYCSKACRRIRLTDADFALEQDVLAARGEVDVVQAGRVVDPSRARGPLGVRLAV